MTLIGIIVIRNLSLPDLEIYVYLIINFILFILILFNIIYIYK